MGPASTATSEWETLSSTAARNRAPASAGNGSDGAQSSIVLGPRDRLVGQLYVEGDVRVAGTVEGGLEVTGSVEIDDGGRVTGPVTAHDRLVVGRSGSLLGDVRVARLVVQDGATFSGKVSMGKQVEAPPKPVECTRTGRRTGQGRRICESGSAGGGRRAGQSASAGEAEPGGEASRS